VAGSALRNHLGRSLGYKMAASITTFRAEIQYPIRGLYHIQVVFDNQESISGSAEFE
jgi:hypothetical protein